MAMAAANSKETILGTRIIKNIIATMLISLFEILCQFGGESKLRFSTRGIATG
jgi:hypothetical protein